MGNTPIVIAVLALVLVGMLFGFNIQVSNSFIDTLTSVGGTLSGLGAMAAAFFSWRSVGQWKEEFKHSTLYEYANTLERLLVKYNSEIHEEVFLKSTSNLSTGTKICLNIQKEIGIDYTLAHKKLSELLINYNPKALSNLHIDIITFKIRGLVNEYAVAKYQRDEITRYASDEELVQYSEKIGKMSNIMLDSMIGVQKVFNEAISEISNIRSSL